MTVSKGKDLALGNGDQETYWHWEEELSLVTPFSSVWVWITVIAKYPPHSF